MSRDRRTAKLEDEHARRNPPKLAPLIRVTHDGEHTERLDGSDAPIPAGARLVERIIVDPVAVAGDDQDGPPLEDDASQPAFRIVRADGTVSPSSTMRDDAPAAPLELEPEPPSPPAPRLSPEEQRRVDARESFERRTGEWDQQLRAGLGKPAKKRRTSPRERDGFRRAVKEGRVQVRGVQFFNKPKRGG